MMNKGVFAGAALATLGFVAPAHAVDLETAKNDGRRL